MTPTPKPPLAGLLGAAAVAALIAAPLTAAAQTMGEAPAEVGSVDETELQAFARATISMAEVREMYMEQIAVAESETDREALVEEGNAAMLSALEDEPGMTMERYFEINAAAQEDAELNERIVMMLQEMSPEG